MRFVPFRVSDKVFHAFLRSPMRATCPAYLNSLDLITLRIFDEGYVASLGKIQSLNAYIVVISRNGMRQKKGKAVPLHAMEAHGGRGGIAPTHT
jgi:hypothetical protein